MTGDDDGRQLPWNPKASDRRKLSELVTLWNDLYGHMLKDGLRRKAKLDALSLRLRNPVAANLYASAYTHDRRVRSEQDTLCFAQDRGPADAFGSDLPGLRLTSYGVLKSSN